MPYCRSAGAAFPRYCDTIIRYGNNRVRTSWCETYSIGGAGFQYSSNTLLSSNGFCADRNKKEILDSSVKDTLNYEDGKFKLIKEVNVDVDISEIQGNLVVDQSVLDYIVYNEEEYINGYMEYIFNKYKEKDLDIFDIKRLAEMYFPKEDIEDPLSIADLEVRTKLTIKGTGVAKDSL